MKVILFGATGMVGGGALRECLLDGDVSHVLSIGRAATGQRHAKLREVTRGDVSDLAALRGELADYDACLFCLGVSSAGMAEENYRRLTYDLTLAVARTLAECNPAMTFEYVSGAGTDGTARGRSMWARVKGETENALLKLPFKAAYMLRPGVIQPLHGNTSRTPLYRAFYTAAWPLLSLSKTLLPSHVTTTERLGRAMLLIAKHGAPKRVLETRDIHDVLVRAADAHAPA